MDRGKKPSKLLASRNSKLYMDLKDIVREHALPFLPAKSVYRCQGVCRDWKLHVATPFFAHNQSLSFRRISGVFSQIPGNPPSFISIDPKSCGVPDPSLKFLPVPVDIRSSSKGLLCCQGRTGDKSYYICNPVTKQWKIIPKPNANHGPDPALVLVFEPSLLNFIAEYKLVCAFPSVDFDGATEFEIYSSKDGCWRVSGETFFADRYVIPRTGVHVNGVVYWQTSTGSIVAFDLMKDRSQLIQGYLGAQSCMGVMEGKLCTSYQNGSSVVLNVLSNVHSNTMHMGSNVRMWSDKYTFRVDYGALGLVQYDNGCIFFVGDDMVLGQTGGVMFSYDLKRKKIKAMSKSPDFDARLVPYVDTLVYL